MLPAVTVVSFLSGSALLDGYACSESSDRCSRDVAASFWPAVAAAAVYDCKVRVAFSSLVRLLSQVTTRQRTSRARSQVPDRVLPSRMRSGTWKGARSQTRASGGKPKLREKHQHPCHRLSMIRPRASRSSSHRDERWEGCRV